MLDRLPNYIDPLLFAERRSAVSGAIQISAFDRLSDLLLDDSGEAIVAFSFGKADRLPIISGSVQVELVLECQSCLQPLRWVVDVQFKLGVVTSLTQVEHLPEDVEPLLLEDNQTQVSLIHLAEDEILLALPDFPRHVEPCIAYSSQEAVTSQAIQDKPQTHNPFAVLAKLKTTGDE